MLKLSMFKAIRKFSIFQGKMNNVEDLLQNETVEFYNAGVEEIQALQNAISKEDKDSDKVYFLELIRNLTNIEVDIDVKELNSMFKKPSPIFAELYSNIFEHVAYLVESSKVISNVELKVNDTLEKMGITKEMIEQVEKQEQIKTKQQRLDQVNLELETCEDLGRYKELQALKSELEKEVELNE